MMLLAETDDQIKGLQEKLNSVQSVSEWLALNKQIYVSKLYKARYCKKFDKSKESDRPLSKPVLEQEDIHILLRRTSYVYQTFKYLLFGASPLLKAVGSFR
ncbi:hypothetical protein RF11_13031 [Thelohanellus kitauei]|uniref:Uncharacterized protein n=1 Tax=Thelohanellus kitauei TaxID=669202 RepID=A0A0C2JRW2_THEKT|nr:hypothetical protein RF11_13031 [Thelohanellus kitauei]